MREFLRTAWLSFMVLVIGGLITYAQPFPGWKTDPNSGDGIFNFAHIFDKNGVCIAIGCGGATGITGTGISPHIAKFTASHVIADSVATDDGTTFAVGEAFTGGVVGSLSVTQTSAFSRLSIDDLFGVDVRGTSPDLTVVPDEGAASTSEIDMLSYGSPSLLQGFRADGVRGTQTALLNGEDILTLQFNGWGGSTVDTGGDITCTTTQNWNDSATSSGANCRWRTMSNGPGVSTPITRITIADTVTISALLNLPTIPVVASCSGQPSKSVIAITGSGTLTLCP